jgi:DNA-binding FadR family transcriptional regulator
LPRRFGVAVEHSRIVDALVAGKRDAALSGMREHLADRNERLVQQARKSTAAEDLGTVFGHQARA